jgi:hypothetical protein
VLLTLPLGKGLACLLWLQEADASTSHDKAFTPKGEAAPKAKLAPQKAKAAPKATPSPGKIKAAPKAATKAGKAKAAAKRKLT